MRLAKIRLANGSTHAAVWGDDDKLRRLDLLQMEQYRTLQDVLHAADPVGLAKYLVDQKAPALSLDQVTLLAPFDGIITRRNIEEGENVVVGTMNNAGSQLMTLADMSIIEAEVEVDETEIPSVQIGQAAKIKIDALPEKSFTGKVRISVSWLV